MAKTSKPATRKQLRPQEIGEVDLAPELMGKNALQGEDQSSIHNERQVAPGVKADADDDLIETYEKSDKDIRAKRDLGKGRRHSPAHPYNKPEPEAESG